MMYIFISGYDYDYRANIYRTLASPAGTVNGYTFKIDGLAIVINKVNSSSFTARDVLIVFVDRYGGTDGGTYEYYPIRKATYHSLVENPSQTRVTFYVELGEYVFPHNWKNIQADVRRLGDIPKKSTDANAKKDGQYITVRDDNIIRSGTYYTGTDGWNAAVKELSTKRAFLAIANRELDYISTSELANAAPFFYRLEYEKKNKIGHIFKCIAPISPINDPSRGLISPFRFSSSNQYRLQIHFYCPLWEANSDAKISLQMKSETQGENISPVIISYGDAIQDYQGVKTIPLNLPQADCFLSFNAQAVGLPHGKTLVDFQQKTFCQIQRFHISLKVAATLLFTFTLVLFSFCKLLHGYQNQPLPEDQRLGLLEYFLENGRQLLEDLLGLLKPS